MARGWESKSVEAQQSEEPLETKPRVTAREREYAAKQGLDMSRRRIVRELESARSEVHRAALENALRYLDEELAKLHG